jgi:hypothetical protein
VEEINGTTISQTALAEELQAVLDARKADKLTIFHYDVKLSGESATKPAVRKPPLRGHFKKCMNSVFAARQDKLLANDVFVFWDGGKKGNENELMSIFRRSTEDDAGKRATINLEKKKITLSVVYTEESIRERRERVRGLGSIKQLEFVHVVTHKSFTKTDDRAATVKDRLKYTGTIAGNVLGPVGLPSYDTEWQETYKVKKDIFGTARVAVGGRTDGDDSDDSDGGDAKRAKIMPRDPDSREPVFYHTVSADVVEEIIHSIAPQIDRVGAVIDFTPGGGVLANICVRKGIPYVGLVFTDCHRDLLTKWVRKGVWQGIQDRGPRAVPVRLGAVAGGRRR